MRKKMAILLTFLLLITVLPNYSVEASMTDMADFAKTYEGTPYKFGGNTPEEGFDCSGFILYVFDKFGKKLPRTSEQQFLLGAPVELADLQPGDLLFFQDTYKPGISHTSIYMGDNKMISAENAIRGVAITSFQGHPYWESRYAGAKRITAGNEKPAPVITPKNFVDVNHNHPAKNAILSLSGSGIINGFPNDEFKPEETITRGQAAAILNRVLNLTPTTTNKFNDVDNKHQFSVHIAAMNEAGILKGYENGNFGLNDNLTRIQLAIIIDRAFNVSQIAGEDVHIASFYEDVPSSYWAKVSINVLKKIDKTTVFQTPTFDLQKNTTRAEFTAAVYSAINLK